MKLRNEGEKLNFALFISNTLERATVRVSIFIIFYFRYFLIIQINIFFINAVFIPGMGCHSAQY